MRLLSCAGQEELLRLGNRNDNRKMPEYVYNPAGERDPFKTFIESVTRKRSVQPPRYHLFRVTDLNAPLRLVGIMMLPGKKVAIVEDPSR